MSLELGSLSNEAKLKILARLAHELTICARDTYDVGTDELRDPHTLRAYNELLHRDSFCRQSAHTFRGFSLESIVQMTRSFGIKHSRVKEMDWLLQRVLQP